jgi:23S rRNA pseudouridine2605 synthase
MTTRVDPEGRPTIFQKLPPNLPRLISVGRLDFNTEGLLLLTNDGALARVLELPATGWLRRYRVRAHGSVTQDKLDALRAGVTISGIHYASIEAAIERVQGANLWLTFAIREGKNREVRNVLGHLGLEVTRLIRVSFGPFQLAELAEGAAEEVRTRVLREQLGARLSETSGADFSAPLRDTAAYAEQDAPIAAARPRSKDQESRDGEPRSHESRRHESRRHETKSHELQRHKSKSQETKRQETKSQESKTPEPKSRDSKSRNSKSHAWRQREQERPQKLLRRKFRGSRREDTPPRRKPAGTAQAGLLMDRKGRHVPVERYAQPALQEPHDARHSKHPPKRGRRRAPDRASGARPRHPQGRR